MNVQKHVSIYPRFDETKYTDEDTEYLHRIGGPAFFREYGDDTIEAWCENNEYHRYGGPAITMSGGKHEYWIRDKNVTDIVDEWLYDHEYEWESMTDIEKWELDLFMRST